MDEDMDEDDWTDDGVAAVDTENLDDVELRIIAEKVFALLQRDALFDRERSGLQDQWSGWRQA